MSADPFAKAGKEKERRPFLQVEWFTNERGYLTFHKQAVDSSSDGNRFRQSLMEKDDPFDVDLLRYTWRDNKWVRESLIVSDNTRYTKAQVEEWKAEVRENMAKMKANMSTGEPTGKTPRPRGLGDL